MHKITHSKILIILLKLGLPILVITDLSSFYYDNLILLNISRFLRIILLVYFVIESIRYFRIIQDFYFSKFLFLFALIKFIYIFTDPIFMEGVWQYSKMLFWILGINVLYAYGYTNKFELSDFLVIAKEIIVLALIFTLIFFLSGKMEENYDIAGYLGVYVSIIVLYTSDNYSKNKLIILICAFVIIITVKRGAILAFLVSNLVYFTGNLISSFSVRKLVAGIFMLTMLFSLAFYLVSGQKDIHGDRLSKEQFDIKSDEAGSGRVGLYRNLFNEWKASDRIIFGFGNQADTHRWGGWRRTHAHSDIFGSLYNYGLVGIVLIILLYIKVLRFHFQYKKYSTNNNSIVIAFFSVLLLANFYSGLFHSNGTFYLFAILPYLQLEMEQSI